MKELAGIILAAGLSSRMKAFKPLLPIDGLPMIMHVIHMMKTAGANPIVVVTGHMHQQLTEILCDIPGIQFVFNPDYATTQQFDSLRLGLQSLKGNARRIMVTPGDVPLVQSTTVNQLLNADGDFIRPLYHDHHGHPVILSNDIIDNLMTYTGPGGLKGAIAHTKCKITDVPVQDPAISMDADTPEDLEKLINWYKTTYAP